MPSAYVAARQRLFSDLLDLVPIVLRFGEDEQLDIPDHDTASLVIRTRTTPDSGLPFLSLPEKDYRRKGPGSAIEQLHRGLRLLVRDRMWRASGHPIPSAAFFRTNRFTVMLLHSSRTLPQDFVDSVWSPVDVHDGWSEALEWRSNLPVPEVMMQSPVSRRSDRHMPYTLPWVSGVCLHDEIYLDGLLLPSLAVLHQGKRGAPAELRLPRNTDEFSMAAKGDQIGDMTWRGVPLKALDPVLGADLRATGDYFVYERSTRVVTEGDFLWQTTHFAGQAFDQVRASFNEQVRRLFLKRARIEATIVRHLEPFAGPA